MALLNNICLRKLNHHNDYLGRCGSVTGSSMRDYDITAKSRNLSSTWMSLEVFLPHQKPKIMRAARHEPIGEFLSILGEYMQIPNNDFPKLRLLYPPLDVGNLNLVMLPNKLTPNDLCLPATIQVEPCILNEQTCCKPEPYDACKRLMSFASNNEMLLSSIFQDCSNMQIYDCKNEEMGGGCPLNFQSDNCHTEIKQCSEENVGEEQCTNYSKFDCSNMEINDCKNEEMGGGCPLNFQSDNCHTEIKQCSEENVGEEQYTNDSRSDCLNHEMVDCSINGEIEKCSCDALKKCEYADEILINCPQTQMENMPTNWCSKSFSWSIDVKPNSFCCDLGLKEIDFANTKRPINMQINLMHSTQMYCNPTLNHTCENNASQADQFETVAAFEENYHF